MGNLRHWVRGYRSVVPTGCLAAVLALASSSCDKSSEPETTSAVEQAVGATYTVKLGFPEGFGYPNTAFLASNSLRLADAIEVRDAAGVPASLVNSGTGSLELGAEAKTGTVVSGGPIVLRSRSIVAGRVQAGATLTRQDGVVIRDAVESNHPLGLLKNLVFTAQFPPATVGVFVNNDGHASRTPGSYTDVLVRSRGTLKLTAGKYYFTSLTLEPQARLELDTSAGPVMVFTEVGLDFRGQVVNRGKPRSFLLAHMGDSSLSLESPFDGTLLAPRAALRLAPVGSSVGHRGSFFARSIDAAEARSKVTFEPFDYWYELLDIHPLVSCALRFKWPAGNALLGYENKSDFDVTVPRGPANLYGPKSLSVPPEVLLPGKHEQSHFADFDIGLGLTWQLAGEMVSVDTSTRHCGLADVPPELRPKPQEPGAPVIDQYGAVPASVVALMHPDVHSSAFRTAAEPLPAGVHVFRAGDAASGSRSTLTPTRTQSGATGGQAVSEQPLLVPVQGAKFRFKVTSLHYSDSEGLCGSVDPYVDGVQINGQSVGSGQLTTEGPEYVAPICLPLFGCLPSHDYTVENVPLALGTVPVVVGVTDSDGLLCGGDDSLGSETIQVVNQGVSEGCTPNGHVCWKAWSERRPGLCFGWNAEYIDSALPTSGVREDYLTNRNLNRVPASFARVQVKLKNGNREVYSYVGPLNEEGCVPNANAANVADLSTGQPFELIAELSPDLCLEPIGQRDFGCDYANHPGDIGTRITIVTPGQDQPGRFCSVITAPGVTPSAATQGCELQVASWGAQPPGSIEFAQTDKDDVTRAAASFSQLMKREVETQGAFGLLAAPGTAPRFSGNLLVRASEFCPNTTSTCFYPSDRALYLQPRGAVDRLGQEILAASSSKFTMPHEFTHALMYDTVGNWSYDYSFDYGSGPGIAPASLGGVCSCDHVPEGEGLHCLQSIEESSAAQAEGLAQAVSAMQWNDTAQQDCSFSYYKPLLDTQCMPDSPNCQAASTAPNGDALWVSQPPFAINCATPKKWRNQRCLDSNSSPALAGLGTEWDWMGFFYSLMSTGLSGADAWNLSLLLEAYQQACAPGCVGEECRSACEGKYLSWDHQGKEGCELGSSPECPVSLLAGAYAKVGQFNPRGRHFLTNGFKYGITEDLTP